MKKILATLVGSSILAAGMLAASAPAKAATFACSNVPGGISDNVSGTSGCEISRTAEQDFLNTNPMTVNAEGFFGFTDWAFGGKIGKNTGYTGSGEGQSGTWNISSVFQNTWDDVMLIFKSGEGTTLTGYLLQDGVKSGSWTSPFEKLAFDFTGKFNGKGPKDVSHISVYYRNGSTPPQAVPEPATLLALGLVGGAMVVSRRRSMSKTV